MIQHQFFFCLYLLHYCRRCSTEDVNTTFSPLHHFSVGGDGVQFHEPSGQQQQGETFETVEDVTV